MNSEDTKLIIFGWLVTYLPELVPQIIESEEKRLKVNELVDKIYEVMQ